LFYLVLNCNISSGSRQSLAKVLILLDKLITASRM